jgi:dTDP-4-amino-4,6-dideoxygalactose transaminase
MHSRTVVGDDDFQSYVALGEGCADRSRQESPAVACRDDDRDVDARHCQSSRTATKPENKAPLVHGGGRRLRRRTFKLPPMRADGSSSALRFQTPQLPGAEDVEEYFRLSREARWFSNDGPCSRLLSRRLSERLGGPDCVLVANGTLGVMVALRALTEDRPPDALEVVVPSFTYIATVSAILWAGLQPVFVDVDADHWHVAPASLDRAIHERRGSLACLLPCSTFGVAPPDETRRAWEALAGEAGLPLLVDSAAGLGSTDAAGIPLGRQGDAEVFSMHATKSFAVGEGGLVTTRRPKLAQRLRQILRFGLDESSTLVGEPGLNGKMSEVHAATGLAVLDHFDEIISRRRASAARLVEALSDRGFGVQVNAMSSSWQFVPVLAPDAAVKRRLLAEANSLGVELRDYHQPLHLMPPLRRYEAVGRLDATIELASRIVSLPMANDLDDGSLDCICSLALGALVQ